MYYYLIALQIRDLFTSDALVDVASGDVWRRIAETFLLDASVRSQMDPSAVRMIAGYIRQAYTRDMVQLSSAELSTISGIFGETTTGGETGTPHGKPPSNRTWKGFTAWKDPWWCIRSFSRNISCSRSFTVCTGVTIP